MAGVSYATLLAALSAMLLLLPPLVAAGYGGAGSFVLTAAVLFAGGYAASDTLAKRTVTAILLALAVCAEALVLAVPTTATVFASRLLSAGYLVHVAAVVMAHVIGRERATLDAVLGGICVYLLIGVIFYAFFCVVEVASPGAFLAGGSPIADAPGSNAALGRYPDLYYFSIVTLTTLGYGDITPATPMARSLAAACAVVGQVYLAVLMAGLVGMHLARRNPA